VTQSIWLIFCEKNNKIKNKINKKKSMRGRGICIELTLKLTLAASDAINGRQTESTNILDSIAEFDALAVQGFIQSHQMHTSLGLR
jgi:hypothetical protein